VVGVARLTHKTLCALPQPRHFLRDDRVALGAKPLVPDRVLTGDESIAATPALLESHGVSRAVDRKRHAVMETLKATSGYRCDSPALLARLILHMTPHAAGTTLDDWVHLAGARDIGHFWSSVLLRVKYSSAALRPGYLDLLHAGCWMDWVRTEVGWLSRIG
jgi:hypothetical protein